MKSLFFVSVTLAVFVLLYPPNSNLPIKEIQTHSDCGTFDTDVSQNLAEETLIIDSSEEEKAHIYPKRLDSPHAAQERATNLLENFVRDLKSYSHQTGFDYIRFLQHKEFLSHSFTNIGNLVLQLGRIDDSLDCRYSFTKDRLEIMMIVSHHMQTATSENDAPHCLLFDVCDLRIMVLALFDSKGEPDRTDDDYDEKVWYFAERLKMLEIRHRRLVEMPLSVRIVAWDHLMKTDMLLRYLEQSE